METIVYGMDNIKFENSQRPRTIDKNKKILYVQMNCNTFYILQVHCLCCIIYSLNERSG